MTTKSKTVDLTDSWGNSIYHLQRQWGTVPLAQRKQNVPSGYLVDAGLLKSAYILNGNNPGGLIRWGWSPFGYSSPDLVNAMNKAYENFNNGLHTPSQWAVNAAEHKQATSMIAKRAGQLLGAAISLRKGDVAGAASKLGLNPKQLPRGGKRKAKSFADSWLELHFGWEPLVQDIGAGVKTLTKPIKPSTVRGKASSAEIIETREDNYRATHVTRLEIKAHILLQAQVSVSNPWSQTANDLGFVNPASVAWELVPFSFVVDWFSNVGQVLGAMTDFVGYDIKNSFNTRYITWNRNEVLLWKQSEDAPNSAGGSAEGYQVVRSGSIPTPRLGIKPFHGFGPVRGATAIALLVQHLK
ncbi:TPA_asm: maturation protein [ssRNA phage Gerhypos.4_67]|uniref:Maturation protein n=2 Tax=Fiersviridae TaxID=2842319 RepID=A0A8S5L1Y1_9VIRU|nr:maturation protein [ssRNA phage Gerhypos.4_67]QDH90400.1 MAG: hypothetical protein H4Bulk48492_000003 [Leviviridae sp.]DAD51452.1 TPA_asm: maturation protein [ssRNA phage Gerhypos.4_67]